MVRCGAGARAQPQACYVRARWIGAAAQGRRASVIPVLSPQGVYLPFLLVALRELRRARRRPGPHVAAVALHVHAHVHRPLLAHEVAPRRVRVVRARAGGRAGRLARLALRRLCAQPCDLQVGVRLGHELHVAHEAVGLWGEEKGEERGAQGQGGAGCIEKESARGRAGMRAGEGCERRSAPPLPVQTLPSARRPWGPPTAQPELTSSHCMCSTSTWPRSSCAHMATWSTCGWVYNNVLSNLVQALC